MGRTRETVRAYRLIVAMWVRSTMAYRASFVLTAFGNFAATGLDFVTIMLMFSHITALGGFTLPEVAFLYGTTSTAFGIADLVMGSMDRLGRRVRDGTLDTLLLRPVPVLAQVAADRFALRRLGRITQGVLVLVLGADAGRRGLDAGEGADAADDAAVRRGDLLRGLRGGRRLPVPRGGRLRGAELRDLRRQHAARSTRRDVRQGPRARV